jgi:hypothetical protein
VVRDPADAGVRDRRPEDVAEKPGEAGSRACRPLRDEIERVQTDDLIGP